MYKKTIDKRVLFPFDNGIANLYNRLEIDDESVYFISTPNDASSITNIILQRQENCEDLSIIDATAGVGGNVFSFAKAFKNVIAVEISNTRSKMLLNNVSVYELKNVSIIEGDSIEVLKDEEYDIAFIDPPWGGSSYKEVNNISLSLSSVAIELLCINLLNIKKRLKMIVLKLPKNYNLEKLYFTIKENNLKVDIYKYDLRKMLIITICVL